MQPAADVTNRVTDDTERFFPFFRSCVMVDPFLKIAMKGRMNHEMEEAVADRNRPAGAVRSLDGTDPVC